MTETQAGVCRNSWVGPDACQLPQNQHNREIIAAKWRKRFLSNHKKRPTTFAGKSDIKSAFRILGLAKSCWKWLVMKAQDPISNKWYFLLTNAYPLGLALVVLYSKDSLMLFVT